MQSKPTFTMHVINIVFSIAIIAAIAWSYKQSEQSRSTSSVSQSSTK